MRNRLFFLLPVLVFCACSPRVRTDVYVRPQPPVQPRPVVYTGQDEASFQVFYDELAPYGSWFNYPDYGYVWRPNVNPDFRPYRTNGHWVYSDEGWTWVSNYPWGWAAFHYGRWFYENGYGWLWLPGHQWAPAWVTWGRSGDYYGWAAIAPRIDIDIHSGGGWVPPAEAWNFVPSRHITQTNVENYVVVNNNRTVINNITKNVTIINNVNNTHVTNVTSNNVVNNNVVNDNSQTKNHVSNTRVNNNQVINNSQPNNRVNHSVSDNMPQNNQGNNRLPNSTIPVNNTGMTGSGNLPNHSNSAPDNGRPANMDLNNPGPGRAGVNYNQPAGRPRPSVIYNRGPVVGEVEVKTQSKIPPVSIQENTKPVQSHVQDNHLILFRPQVQPNPRQNQGQARPAPRQVEDLKRRKGL